MIASNVIVYGDSIMKATVPDDDLRPKFNIGRFIERIKTEYSIGVINRARYGATINKGIKDLSNDLSKGIKSEHALLEYRGNDCDFDWKAVSEAPSEVHLPKTVLTQFLSTLKSMVKLLRQAGIDPVLMTLPPIDAERYLGFIVRGGLKRENILKWLGDVQTIYRFHELYSNAIARFADKEDLEVIDIRSRFLDKHDFKDLISDDGIHPTIKGYELVYDSIAEYIRTRRAY